MQSPRPRRALVVADGDVPTTDTVGADYLRSADGERPLVIAADGGLRKALAIGLRPDVVVGDGDSLVPDALEQLAADGVDVQLHQRDKDESDTELAVREAVRRGADRIDVIGALGGQRFDHALANVLLLSTSDIDAEITLVDGSTSVRVIGRRGAEELAIDGAQGDFVSLLPLSDVVDGVTTSGLAYPLERASLRQGPTLGLSNELTSNHATVRVDRGRLAVIHTRRQEMS